MNQFSTTNDYQGTPSFYNSQEVFERFLAGTSYYLGLQNAVSRLVSLIKPKNMLELGFGTGATACRLASEHPDIGIDAIDARANMIPTGEEQARLRQLDNVRFTQGDLLDYVDENKHLPDLVYMLYVFHHIPDPSEKKIEFLKTCKDKLPEGGYLCIADVFIPETPNKTELEARLLQNWSMRIMEAYSSVFWTALDDVNPESVARAQQAGRYSMKQEQEAGDLVIRRDKEYMVSTAWLVEEAGKIGFSVIVNEPVNTVGDSVVLLRNDT